MKIYIELDELNELKERVEILESDLSSQIYMGNSIGYTYQKLEKYSGMLMKTCSFIRKAAKEGRLDISNCDSEDCEVLKMVGVLDA